MPGGKCKKAELIWGYNNPFACTQVLFT